MSVSVIIPAYNEASTIGATVRAASRLKGVVEVVVVDDGSHDSTAEEARLAGARVIRHDDNRGKGQAMMTGLSAAAGDIVLFLDGDLEETAAAAWALVEAVRGDRCDLAVAAFPRRGTSAGFGLVKRLARLAVRALGKADLTEPLSGQRAIRRADLEQILPLFDGFGVELAMTIDLLRLGRRVAEIPLPMRHRRTGRDVRGFIHRARQLAWVLRVIASRCRGGRR